MNHVASIKDRLIWARFPDRIYARKCWMGIGLLSDNGLPLCCMHMFLAAKAMAEEAGMRAELIVLLADEHATSAGAWPEKVRHRARARAAEVEAIGDLLGISCEIILASSLNSSSQFVSQLNRACDWVQRAHPGAVVNFSEYHVRGVADVLFFRELGGVKIGWSASSQLQTGRGRRHEPGTDLIAAQINSSVAAVYVRHGVTLDSSRPKGVPYTEMKDTSSRLMLTGPDRGNFVCKLNAPNVTSRRRAAVLEHLTITIEAFEFLVGPLPGANIIAKAESLRQELDSRLESEIYEQNPVATQQNVSTHFIE